MTIPRRLVMCRLLIAKLCLASLAMPVHALSDAEIERRFQLLEQENARLRDKLQSVESILKRQGVDPDLPFTQQPVSSSNTGARPSSALASTSLEHDVEELRQSLKEEQEKIKFGGFISAGVSMSDQDGGLNHRVYGFDDSPDFNSDSVLGLQVSFQIADDLRAVTQIVANGWDDWEPNIEWAYLDYTATDNLSFRAGRMRVPFYLYSESLDVGYSYPWVRPPTSLYNDELSNYDGFDATYHFRTGSLSHRASAFVGSYDFDVNEYDQDVKVESDEAWGANLTSYWGDWTNRFAYVHLRNTAEFKRQLGVIVDPDVYDLLPADLKGGRPIDPRLDAIATGYELIYGGEVVEPMEFYGYALAYDNGRFFSIFEASVIDVGKADLLGDTVAGVWTLGYRYNQWQPYTGFGREYYKQPLDEDNVIARATDIDYKLAFVGLRYDFLPGVAAKLEWDHYYDYKGTSGPFEDVVVPEGDSQPRNANIYTFLIDAVF